MFAGPRSFRFAEVLIRELAFNQNVHKDRCGKLKVHLRGVDPTTLGGGRALTTLGTILTPAHCISAVGFRIGCIGISAKNRLTCELWASVETWDGTVNTGGDSSVIHKIPQT